LGRSDNNAIQSLRAGILKFLQVSDITVVTIVAAQFDGRSMGRICQDESCNLLIGVLIDRSPGSDVVRKALVLLPQHVSLVRCLVISRQLHHQLTMLLQPDTDPRLSVDTVDSGLFPFKATFF
jgi:hypothetical protein